VAGLRVSARAVSDALGAGPGDRWLCCLPVHHVAGLVILGRAWSTSVPCSVQRRFDAAAVASVASDGGATLVSLVPTMVRRLLDAGADLGRFRRVLVGGAALGPDLAERVRRAGASAVTTYGLTETWGGVVHDGHALDGVEIRLGHCDEILVRGPMVMAGYRLRPDETAEVLDGGGWLRTGDVGAVDEQGRLRVVDRRRDLVITGGVNVSPSQVEAVLAHHPDVADVCVGGCADTEWGERVVAYVVPRDRVVPPTLEALRAFARSSLAAADLPRELRLIAAIPRTPGGKPLRWLLAQRSAEQR
jgi:O-succinylbenzoic acid--CoA ligase